MRNSGGHNGDNKDDNLCQPLFLSYPQSVTPLVELAHSIAWPLDQDHDDHNGGVHGDDDDDNDAYNDGDVCNRI